MSSCLYQISKLYDSLSYSEKQLVDYIVSHQHESVHLPIAELASRVGVAPSTIVSTTKKLGFTRVQRI